MKCVIKSCKSNKKKKNASCHVETFHKIPKDRILRDKWLKAINRNPQEYSVNACGVCSCHFDPSLYITSLKGSLLHTSTKKLKKGAIPTLYLDHEETSWEEGEKIQEHTLYLKKHEKIFHVSATRKSPKKSENSDFGLWTHILDSGLQASDWQLGTLDSGLSICNHHSQVVRICFKMFIHHVVH